MNRTFAVTLAQLSALGLWVGASTPAFAKDLIEYFKPTPIVGTLSSTAWGAAATGPRDTSNGLEDTTMKSWQYWDGQILKGADGKYHMFASRWAQSKGMSGWGGSVAVHAVSSTLLGPYVDGGPAYTDSNGKGHNVTAALLPDGKYAIIASDTRPGAIFLASAITGPFAYQGDITVNANGFDASGTTKNLSLTILPDKTFLMATRFGAIMTTPTSLLGPWTVQGPRVFTTPSGYPNGTREDPVIWCSGGQFHLVYNYYELRKARHMTSPDGIKNWKDVGLAYDPTANFVRYTDGTVNHWEKMERAGVYLENGHVVAFTFAVIDVAKTSDLGNDTHGTKVIVVPFDGETFDADTGVAGNACSTYSANSGVPGTGSTGGTGGSGGTSGTGGAGGAGGTVARDAGSSDGAVVRDTGASSDGTASGGAVVTTGGNSALGGTVAAGGTTVLGGTMAAGGSATSGGRMAVGGTTASGGSTAVAATGGTATDGTATGGTATSGTATDGTAAGGTMPGSSGGATASGGLSAMGGTVQPGSGGSIASTASLGGQPGTTVTNNSPSPGCTCTFAPGPGARPVSIAWAFAIGLAWLMRSRRRDRYRKP